MNEKLEKVAVGRNNNIDFLRFSLASLVIFSHSFGLVYGVDDSEPIAVATGGQLNGGALAVDCFFILSGFLITRSWLSSRSVGDYLSRRALRIYPGFVGAILFSGLIAAPLLAESSRAYWEAFSWRDFLLQGANLQLAIPKLPISVNASLWTIRYEFVCYLAVIGFAVCGAFRHRSLLLLALLLCETLYAGRILLGWKVPGGSLGWLIGYTAHWPRFMSNFLAGAAFYCYRDRVVLSQRLVLAALAILLFFGVVATSPGLLPLLVPVLGGYVLFRAAYAPMGRVRHFARRGDFSYGIYLYAFPIQHLLVEASGRRLHPVGLFVLAWGVTLGVAALSWRFVEAPFLRLKRSTSSREACAASRTPVLATLEKASGASEREAAQSLGRAEGV